MHTATTQTLFYLPFTTYYLAILFHLYCSGSIIFFHCYLCFTCASNTGLEENYLNFIHLNAKLVEDFQDQSLFV
jgi:hypothetical protein